MDLSLHLLSDPNANKNQIPENTELNELRNLAQCNLRLINDLNRQLEEQRNDCAAIQQRYEEQIRAFKKQIQALEMELNQIKKLIHPIHRCPSDILQCIFEWAVEMEEPDWFTTATRLSQVCHRWRNIALNTPYLWFALNVSLKREPNRVKEIWERTVTRIKAVPISIFIVDVNDANAQWRVMEECKFNAFPQIECLGFDISNRDAVVRFSSPQFHPPTGRLDGLSLQYTGRDRDAPLDFSPIIDRFSSVTTLVLTKTPPLTFGADFIAPAVTKLGISETKGSSINILVQTFPNAELVELQEVKLQLDVVGIVTWPELRFLSCFDCDNIPWGSLQAPNITNLTWHKEFRNNPGEFIISHRSLQHLDLTYNENYIDAVASAAPHLLTLAIDSCEEIGNQSIMAFDKLTDLTICHSIEAPLTLDRFEKIVRCHFLPKNNKREGKNQDPSLTVLVDLDIEIKDTEWLGSELISSATQSVSTVERWGYKHRSYCLHWKASSC